jgi:hypothetical protein
VGRTLKADPKLSGLYKEFFHITSERKAKDMELELRVDIDGERPMNVISGDLYSNSGGTRDYLSSFLFENVEKVKTATNEIRISGANGKFYSDIANFTDIRVIISLDSCPLKATVKLIKNTSAESKFFCKHKSEFFRTAQVEYDYEEEVVPFESYNTENLFSPLPHRPRLIGISDVFAEAGIQMIFLKKEQSFVLHPKGVFGGCPIWTQNELYDAMLKHFSIMKNEPQWAVWLLSAGEYVISDIKGTMILHEGKNRRGCAVFQNATGWQSPAEKRMRLFIYIHELGHCLNLRHPWSGIPTNSSEWIKAHSSLSWMNYPWRFYLSREIRGEEAFWERFNFQFSDSELMHLRHGFRNDVIFGGN